MDEWVSVQMLNNYWLVLLIVLLVTFHIYIAFCIELLCEVIVISILSFISVAFLA